MQAKLTLRAVRSNDAFRGDYDDDDAQTPYTENNEEFNSDDERFYSISRSMPTANAEDSCRSGGT